MDLVVTGGAVFELKAVEQLTDAHRNQLLHYLLLTGLKHGKLINFGNGSVEQEFVNASISRAESTAFDIQEERWQSTSGFTDAEKQLTIDVLRDWGTLDSTKKHLHTSLENMVGYKSELTVRYSQNSPHVFVRRGSV